MSSTFSKRQNSPSVDDNLSEISDINNQIVTEYKKKQLDHPNLPNLKISAVKIRELPDNMDLLENNAGADKDESIKKNDDSDEETHHRSRKEYFNDKKEKFKESLHYKRDVEGRKESEIKEKVKRKPIKEIIFRKKKKKEKRSKMEYELYFMILAIYVILGNIIPLALFFYYLYEVVWPLFGDIMGPVMENNVDWVPFYNLIHIDEIFKSMGDVLDDPVNLTNFLTAPLVFLGMYILKYVMYAIVGRSLYRTMLWIRPRKELKYASFDGPEADDINIYHTRAFLLRLLKYQFEKSPFTWFTPWMYNFVGSNKMGKNVTLETGLVSLEFLDFGDNVYFGPMSGTSSHVMEGTYQSLTLWTIKVEDNVVVGSRCGISPGNHLEEDSQLLPFSGNPKFQKITKGTNFQGIPSNRLSYAKYVEILNLPKDVIKKDKELVLQRRKRLKKSREEEKTSLAEQKTKDNTN